MTTETQPRAASAGADERSWVFSPEEPETYVNVNGRVFQFQNGRLAGHLVGLTEGDLEWFADARRPEYIVHRGSLDDMELYRELHTRVMRMASRKADASDVVKVMDHANFLLAVMLSEQTLGGGASQSPAAIVAGLGAIERQLPSMRSNTLFQAVMSGAAGRDADDAAIARGLAGVGDPDALEVAALRAQDQETAGALAAEGAAVPATPTNPFSQQETPNPFGQ